MKDKLIEIHLSDKELQYLARFLPEKGDVFKNNQSLIKIDIDEAKEIGNELTRLLAISGFDENYLLTREGEVIENLIEKFNKDAAAQGE